MLRVRYVGTGSGVTIPGIGEVQPGGVIDVPDEVGRKLIERPDFNEVREVEPSYVSPSAEYASNSSSTDITVTTTVTDQNRKN